MFTHNNGYQKQHDLVVNQEAVSINFDELHFKIFTSNIQVRHTLSNDLRLELLDIIQHDDAKRFKKFIKKNNISRYPQIMLSGKAECQHLSFISKDDSTLEDLLSFFGKYKVFKKSAFWLRSGYRDCNYTDYTYLMQRSISSAVWGGQLTFLKEIVRLPYNILSGSHQSGFLLNNNRFGDPEITKLLLEKGVPQTHSPSRDSPLITIIKGSTPQKSLAERGNRTASAKLLLIQDKDQINVRCKSEYSPYIYAMENNDEPMMSWSDPVFSDT